MTSPRTPRQPRERGCFHTAPCSCPNRYLSEVLPETPEPPTEADFAPFAEEAAEFAALCGYGPVLRRCPNDDFPIRDEEAGCPRCKRPGAASQSVPAVPVSSTGGKETGEAAEDAQGAAEADWTEESRFADFREAYDYATIHFSAAIRAHAKVDRREAYQIWHTIQLGMEKIQRERSPLPDSETERPRRCPALTPESDLITEGRQCQQYEGHAFDHAWYGDNGHAYSLWAVTS